MKLPYLTVVIPAFNESERIGSSLKTIHSYLSKMPYEAEIVVVDNGSEDETAAVVRSLMSNISNLRLICDGFMPGKGYAVARGILQASGKYVLFSDADLSTPIEEVEKLLNHLKNGADIAIGSRGLRISEIIIHQPWHRERLGKAFNLLVQAIVIRGIKDTQCGFKCFKQETIATIFKRQSIFGFGFDVEILFIARKHGYKIAEVPVRWINDPKSHVRPIKDGFRMVTDLIRIRINEARGVYV